MSLKKVHIVLLFKN